MNEDIRNYLVVNNVSPNMLFWEHFKANKAFLDVLMLELDPTSSGGLEKAKVSKSVSNTGLAIAARGCGQGRWNLILHATRRYPALK